MKKYKKLISAGILASFLSLSLTPAYAIETNETVDAKNLTLTEVGHGEYTMSTTRNNSGVMVEKYRDTIYQIVQDGTKTTSQQAYFIQVDDDTFLQAEEVVIDTQNKEEVKEIIQEHHIDENTAELLLDETTSNTVYLYSTASPNISSYAYQDGYYYRVADAYYHGSSGFKSVADGYELKDKIDNIVTNAVEMIIGDFMSVITLGGWSLADLLGYSLVPEPADVTPGDKWQVKVEDDKQRRSCFMSRVESEAGYYPLKAVVERASVEYTHNIYLDKLINDITKYTYETIYSDHYNNLVDFAIQNFHKDAPPFETIEQYKVGNVTFNAAY